MQRANGKLTISPTALKLKTTQFEIRPLVLSYLQTVQYAYKPFKWIPPRYNNQQKQEPSLYITMPKFALIFQTKAVIIEIIYLTKIWKIQNKQHHFPQTKSTFRNGRKEPQVQIAGCDCDFDCDYDCERVSKSRFRQTYWRPLSPTRRERKYQSPP